MAQGERLTLHERGSILAFRKAKWTIRKSAAELFLSKGAVANFIKNSDTYGTKPIPGRPLKLAARDVRRVLREASEGRSSSSKIQHDLQRDVTARILRRVLQRSKRFIYKKRKTTSRLTKVHKQARVDWAKEHVVQGPHVTRKTHTNQEGPTGATTTNAAINGPTTTEAGNELLAPTSFDRVAVATIVYSDDMVVVLLELCIGRFRDAFTKCSSNQKRSSLWEQLRLQFNIVVGGDNATTTTSLKNKERGSQDLVDVTTDEMTGPLGQVL
ncbi:hypothetical protein H257_09082 [Aphanomyces astaci]|uniref:Transposase Tc1-like domain-containing protein n=1 Tax=Aphanomyces astaci TaxID=112090 RepID=W4GC04_APHAT|nr:hypothetical protein H257_09082 [Aphanomyces astaci]ETV77195.1 hypothetical protein H257_09082 [Aphanomyces astaci]|eukprot:XP_009833501.1 hypothetical protein H257_09082 [Aphanomyces astaci]